MGGPRRAVTENRGAVPVSPAMGCRARPQPEFEWLCRTRWTTETGRRTDTGWLPTWMTFSSPADERVAPRRATGLLVSVRVEGGRSVPAGRSSGTLREARWRRQTASCRGLNSPAMPPASAPHFLAPPPVLTAVLDRKRAPREAFGASRKRRGVGWFHQTSRGGVGACARCNCRFVDARKRPLESE